MLYEVIMFYISGLAILTDISANAHYVLLIRAFHQINLQFLHLMQMQFCGISQS